MIYICYGITKSASTFLYQLTEETFIAAGRRITRLGPPLKESTSVENYFDFINLNLLSEIQEHVKGQDVVLKTHGPPLREVAELIASGRILANSSIRDPREIALSMIDHGERSRRWKNTDFSEFVAVSDTLDILDIQISFFQAWAQIDGVRIFKYNDICHDSASVVRSIVSQIGTEVDIDKVLNKFRSKTTIGQFSKGKALRYTEMSPDDQSIFLERYAEFYKAFAFDTPNAHRIAAEQKGHALRPSGELAQRLINFRRRFRL
ncbi:hypothetical protein [Bosea vaviloviae]|uniref:Sulfotransferase domain-containing protein n=1 Tax=Bosea vaviloviae TaxID=1526658 RepID=A0A1D7U7R7_9HYPH|nr:hypothetical protein [Bosea vaviloviae]AOO83413.1 hypothetical protein BHK69_25875 [Bosea vaviloviae]